MLIQLENVFCNPSHIVLIKNNKLLGKPVDAACTITMVNSDSFSLSMSKEKAVDLVLEQIKSLETRWTTRY